ncbi:MAG: NUMOD4 domain-containing protein [Paenisporosarcina sp.]
MEITKPIEGFPNYVVSNYGRVFNIATDRELTLSHTTKDGGDLSVGMFRDNRQHRYSVKCLVARAFVEGETELFNTPVLLDGDRFNLRADNIVWRPRWFACTYVRQFSRLSTWINFGPIVDVTTGTKYDTIYDAATTNGLLLVDVMDSVFNEKIVFPTRQRFIYL